MVMARLSTGFAVIGDTQHLPGYSLLLSDDPAADHLTDLPPERRRQFLFEMSLIGQAIEVACRPRGLRRINYEVLGNSINFLHAHIHPRYDWEAPDMARGPVWRYPRSDRDNARHAYSDQAHGELRAAITEALEGLVRAHTCG
jgi:diadenosine tetraphosphate (Ap4A) HIT family hydrolase